MPEEVNPVTPQQPTTAIATKNTISWKNIVIGAVIGAVLLGVGGYLVYNAYQPKSSEPTVTTTKKATPSAKPATPSAQKDETADWKTYTSKLKVFEIKYPKNVTAVTNSQNNNSEQLVLSLPESDKTLTGIPNIAIEVNWVGGFCAEAPEPCDVSKEVTFAGKKATLFTYNMNDKKVNPDVDRDQHYQILSLKNNNRVTISLNFRRGSEQLFDQILSTFRFE